MCPPFFLPPASHASSSRVTLTCRQLNIHATQNTDHPGRLVGRSLKLFLMTAHSTLCLSQRQTPVPSRYPSFRSPFPCHPQISADCQLQTSTKKIHVSVSLDSATSGNSSGTRLFCIHPEILENRSRCMYMEDCSKVRTHPLLRRSKFRGHDFQEQELLGSIYLLCVPTRRGHICCRGRPLSFRSREYSFLDLDVSPSQALFAVPSRSWLVLLSNVCPLVRSFVCLSCERNQNITPSIYLNRRAGTRTGGSSDRHRLD